MDAIALATGANVAHRRLDEHAAASETTAAAQTEEREAIGSHGDVRRFRSCQKAVAATLKRFRHVDVLVSTAALQGRPHQ